MMATHHCPQCGADLTGQPRCWLCYSETGARSAIDPPPIVRSRADLLIPPPAHHVPWQFGLDSLLLMMTFAAVLVGAFAAAPGLGVALALVSAAPLLRTVVVARKGRVAGAPLTTGQKALSFVAGVAFIVVLAVSVGIAFYLTCWVGFLAGTFGGAAFGIRGLDLLAPGFLIGGIFGVASGIAVAVWIIRRTIRRDFSIPHWLPWFALVVGLVVMAAWLIFARCRMEEQVLLLIISAVALGVALVSLRIAKPLVNSIAIGLCGGPAAAALLTMPLNGRADAVTMPMQLTIRALAIVIAVAVATAVYYQQLRHADRLAAHGRRAS